MKKADSRFLEMRICISNDLFKSGISEKLSMELISSTYKGNPIMIPITDCCKQKKTRPVIRIMRLRNKTQRSAKYY